MHGIIEKLQLKGSNALENINKLVDEIIDDNDRLSKLDFDKDLTAQLEAKKEANKMMKEFKERLATVS